MNKKSFLISIITLLLAAAVFAQDLTITVSDIRIEQGVDGGFHLFIRKKPGIGSVLLTESTKDPALQADNFAYRSPDWNRFNGDEIRFLNGEPLPQNNPLYSLIDSTTEADAVFGQAFHIYIPYILEYGYPWSRQGEVYVHDGTFFNIRSFALPMGNYEGAFKDNPYELKITQKPLAGPPEGNFMGDTVEAFTEIAYGTPIYSTGADDVVDKIAGILDQFRGKSVDIVLCLDTTESMENDIDPVRRRLIPEMQKIVTEYYSFRIGMVLYKDYFDDYINKPIPFTNNFAVFQNNLNAIRVSGGRDIPETVYEALHQAAVFFPWAADEKIIILIGDAPPHARPRGKITREMVENEVALRQLKVLPIILPQ
ncbi:MAG: hypothetical protein LBV20_02800 [Treponema sp.]|jgi:hypothetical protein|nr:hypothetical protein [Treponema sp.]